MSRRSDLVQDAELLTRFDPRHTVHIYNEIGSNGFDRSVRREEYWERQEPLGDGGFGRVWLERCVRGQGEAELRAVKEVMKLRYLTNQLDYKRELEAITKFSHRNVLSIKAKQL